MAGFLITYRGAVCPWQRDHMGHMNVMWYVGKFDEASWQLLSHLGLTRSSLSKEGRGAVALEQRIGYRRELRAGDLITIRSRVLEVNEKTVRMTHEMTNGDTAELAAVSVILGLYIDVHLRKGCPVPSDVHHRAMLLARGTGDLDMDHGISSAQADATAAAGAHWLDRSLMCTDFGGPPESRPPKRSVRTTPWVTRGYTETPQTLVARSAES